MNSGMERNRQVEKKYLLERLDVMIEKQTTNT